MGDLGCVAGGGDCLKLGAFVLRRLKVAADGGRAHHCVSGWFRVGESGVRSLLHKVRAGERREASQGSSAAGQAVLMQRERLQVVQRAENAVGAVESLDKAVGVKQVRLADFF